MRETNMGPVFVLLGWVICGCRRGVEYESRRKAGTQAELEGGRYTRRD